MNPATLALIQVSAILAAFGVVAHGLLSKPEDRIGQVGPTIFMFLLYIGLALLVGYRDPRVGTDTAVYKEVVWPSILRSSSYSTYLQDQAGVSVGGEMYYHFIKWVGQLVTNLMLFHVAILFLALWWFATEIRRGQEYLLSAYWLLGLPFWSLTINILRAGLCVAMILLAIAFLRRGKTFWAFGWMLLGITFHYSAAVCLVAFAIAKVVKRRKTLEFAMVILTTVLALLSMAGTDKVIVSTIMNHFGISLQAIEVFYQTGFRWDFAFYNIAAYCLLRPVEPRCEGDEFEFCETLLRIYLVLCGFFFIAFQFPYSDRVGMYSWLLIPILCFVEATGISIRRGGPRKLRILALTALSVAVHFKNILSPGVV